MIRALAAAAVLAATSACATVPPQSQASNLAVPDPQPAKLESAVLIYSCNKLDVFFVVDVEGQVHPVDLTGMGEVDVLKILKPISADKTWGFSIPCPGAATL
jgi:hypothetical protein